MTNAAVRNRKVIPIQELIETAGAGFVRKFDSRSLDELKQHGFSTDEIHRFVAPRRTLARRIANNEPLTLAEVDSARRILRIAETAERVLDGPERAQRWLRKPSRALNDVVPIDLLESETGARLVEDELLRIEHGIYL